MERRDLYLITISLILVLLMGCGKSNPASSEISDDDAINLLISSSGYADFSNYADDGFTEFSISDAKSDSFPPGVFFLRRIENRTHEVSITYDSNGTFATARIATWFSGRLVVDNNQNGVCDTVSRAIEDQGLRYVWFRKSDGQWRVYGTSPMAVQTVAPANPVSIDSLKITGDTGLSGGYIFRSSDLNRTVRREEMPIFAQGTEITLTVWASLKDSSSDSCWSFVHRRVINNGVTDHLRLPMARQNAWEFSYIWGVEPADSPEVRHIAADLMLATSLFGDVAAEYSACIWTIPYIVTDNGILPK